MVSCNYTDQKQIGKNYFIRSINSKEFIDIGYGEENFSEGFIPNTVFEVLWNEKYILVKRHPINQSNLVDFFIIKKVKDDIRLASKNRIGPLSKENYKKTINQLNIKENTLNKVVYNSW